MSTSDPVAAALASRPDRRLLIGVVHLPPLPGSPRGTLDLETIEARARADAEVLLAAGFDGWVVENFGDAPFFGEAVPPWVPTVMTRVALGLPRGALAGSNVLRNDARSALAVAIAADLDFIRVNVHVGAAVTDQGVITGRAAETVRDRAALGASVAICADVHVKHAVPLGAHAPDIGESARELAYRGLADALIVTGAATGRAADASELTAVRAAVPDRPLLIGSGADEATVASLLEVADGVIVGTSIKTGGQTTAPVDADRARRFVVAARGS